MTRGHWFAYHVQKLLQMPAIIYQLACALTHLPLPWRPSFLPPNKQALKRVLPGEPSDNKLRPYLPAVTKQAWHL